MFSNNGRISEHQAVRLIILNLFTGASLFLPMALPRVSGDGGFCAWILGILLTWMYVWTILKHLNIRTRKYLEIILGIRCLATYLFLFGLFISVLSETFLFTMSRGWILFGMLCVLIYGASKEVEARARLSELLFYIILVPIFLIGAVSLPEAQWGNVWAIDGITWRGILWGSLITWVLMSPIEWCFLMKDSVKESGNKRTCKRGFIFGTAFAFVIYLLCIVVLDVDSMKAERWPTSILMQIVKLPGGFVSRQDGLMLSFWIFAMFISLSEAANHAFECLFQDNETKKWKKQSVLIVAGGILSYFTGMNRWFLIMYFVLMMVTGVLIFFMGRKAIFVCLILCMVSFTACDNYIEIENRDFVMAIGVDPGEKKTYSFTFVFPNMGELAADSDGEAVRPVVLEAKSLTEAEELYNRMSENFMDFGQVRVIVLGEQMEQSPYAMTDFNKEIKSIPEMARTILMCRSQGSASELIAMDEEMSTSVGIYLEELLNNQDKEVILNDFLKTAEMSHLPTVRIYKERIYLD